MTETPKSPPRDTSTTPPMASCGSCGRFIGPYNRCPYCGARRSGRLSIRAVKIAAVLLATFGLAALWWLARHTDVPQISAAGAAGTMNLAYVRVDGTIVRGLSYEPDSGYLGFWLADETGEIHVNAYRDVTQDLLASGIVPAIGDEISVAGTLRVRETYAALTIDVPEHVRLRRPDPIRLKAGEITILDEGKRVRLTGEVRRCTVPYEGLTLITLADESGEIVIAVDEAVTLLTGALPEISEGQGIEVTGAVTLYRDTPQIAPATVDEIVLSEAPAAPTPLALTPLAALSDDDQGLTARVRGRVVLLEGLKGGVKATLDDGTAEVALLLWDRVHRDLTDPVALDVGAEIEVTGEVELYKGELELVPGSGADVVIVEPAPAPPWVELGDLTPSDAGRVVRARGVLREPAGFSAGVKVPLDDGTGVLTVLLWSNIYEQLDPSPQAGLQVEVVGLIDVYNQKLELIPRSRYDWRVRSIDD
ncbi:MAG: OB-fold nucleic acid binding domain-containing protein [Anaerolineae bacterium]